MIDIINAGKFAASRARVIVSCETAGMVAMVSKLL
jgi:hypothetical protein